MGVSVFMEEASATRRELGYLKVRCGVAEMDREEGRMELMEERERRVGVVIETEMVAVMAIGDVILKCRWLVFSRFHFTPPPERRKLVNYLLAVEQG